MKRKLRMSFYYATRGILYCLRTQPNMRIHIGIGSIAVAAGFALRISQAEWLAIAIVIGFVLILEVLNTAIETLVDLYTEEYHHLAKVAKDTAAGAVMLMAIVSVVVGVIIFGPKLWALLQASL